MWIERFVICGLRGIRHPLEISLSRNGKPTSAVIYGRNGTGKSSIVDAWEWFHGGSVEHLSREGAGKGAYSHRHAQDSWVEVHLRNPDQKVRLSLDGKSDEGDIGAFRALLRNQCHVRFHELKKFVMMSKTDQFNELAQLMGVEEQARYQKELEKARRKVEKSRAAAQRDAKEAWSAVASSLDAKNEDLDSAVARYWEDAGLDPAERPDLANLPAEIESRLARLVGDEQKMAALRLALSQVGIDRSMFEKFMEAQEEFLETRDSLAEELRLSFLELAARILDDADPEEPAECPLCDQPVSDLRGHISHNLEDMAHLKLAREAYIASRTALCEELRSLQRPLEELAGLLPDSSVPSMFSGHVAASLDYFDRSERPDSGRSAENAKELMESAIAFAQFRENELASIEEGLPAGDSDAVTARGLLVDVAKDLRTALGADRRHEVISQNLAGLDALLESYRDRNYQDLKSRFDDISEQVARYFDVLEREGGEPGNAELKLDEGGSAVRLALTVDGEVESPAYRILSESQLNSFGLAVQLAVLRKEETDLRLMILDDVINSFDAYKRSRLIRLLADDFADYQIIVLTHDDVWRERLYRKFRTWNRFETRPFTVENGTMFKDRARTTTRWESARAALENDRPHEAGALFGPYVEARVQELCESCEAPVKYDRGNRHTLEPLLVALRGRWKKKVGKDHAVVAKLVEFERQQFFRNWTAHEKNPINPVSADEVAEAMDLWREIEALTFCDACTECTAYDKGFEGFVCRCEGVRHAKGSCVEDEQVRRVREEAL